MPFKYKKTAAVLGAVFLLALDRFLKALALRLEPAAPLQILGDWLGFDLVRNFYIALSLPLGGWAAIIVGAVLIVLLLAWLIKAWEKQSLRLSFFLLLIILAATSNLYDRAVYGYVIDYFSFKYLFTNNLADIMIFGGVVGLLFTQKKPLPNGRGAP